MDGVRCDCVGDDDIDAGDDANGFGAEEFWAAGAAGAGASCGAAGSARAEASSKTGKQAGRARGDGIASEMDG